MTEMHCTITGTVQRVAFRDYVQRSAEELQLVGWVKNMSDGSVEIVAQGMPDVLKEMVEYLHEGSLNAKVESVGIDWRTAKTVYDDFSILHE